MQATESIHDALREVVRAAGGAKVVGAKLWPAKPISLAQQRVNDSLNPEHPQEFKPCEVLFLLQLGRACGCHAAMQYTASTAGYSTPTPVDSADELQSLQREFIAAAAALKQMSQRIESIASARSALQAVR
jgi:hypothetical protein